jgi:hypothetical protein
MFVHVARPNFREELAEIRKEVLGIKANLPQKTAFQKEYDSLKETVFKQEKTMKELQKRADSLYSLNCKLIGYIEEFEEVKEAGGVTFDFHTSCDPNYFDELQIKVITIPEVKLQIIERRKINDTP